MTTSAPAARTAGPLFLPSLAARRRLSPQARAYISAVSHFYRFAIEIDGHRYTGDWSLVQGGRMSIRSAWGGLIADVGEATPEVVSARVLEQIVRTYLQQRAQELERREQEMARLALDRKRRDEILAEQFEGDADPAWDALRHLVEQIEASDFQDGQGHSLDRNWAFIEARDLLHGYKGA
jgi:hypothetical protein